MPAMAMFPLGTVLVPGMVLPLHVFESRYRELVRDVLEAEPEFGVVLIERGSEVGGGDVRSGVGTVARIVEAAELPDGRYALAAVGTRRIRIDDWLPDDPYPRAQVDEWPDPVPPDDVDRLVVAVDGALRRVLALRAELGDAAAPATVELSDEPVVASYQMTALAPFGPADRQLLLAAPGVDARLVTLQSMLEEEAGFLEQRVAMEDDQPEEGGGWTDG
jgi:uncharacterized protein